MKLSRSTKLLLIILAAGLVSGISGVIKNGGWDIGYSIGFVFWLLFALCAAIYIRRDNTMRN